MIRWDSEFGSFVKGWQADAAKGDAWSLDKLLSRPELPPDAEPYWAAFVYLSRDRSYSSLSLGMAGGLQLPQPITRDVIRTEGQRLAYEGEGLADFVEIVAGIDDRYVEVTTRKAAADAARQAKSKRKG